MGFIVQNKCYRIFRVKIHVGRSPTGFLWEEGQIAQMKMEFGGIGFVCAN